MIGNPDSHGVVPAGSSLSPDSVGIPSPPSDSPGSDSSFLDQFRLDWGPGELFETPTIKRIRERKAAKRARCYVTVSWAQLERLLPVCGKFDLAVWLHLRSLQNVKGKDVWVWANLDVLRSWQIGERSYQRAIANLKRAGLLEVDAQPGRKTRVRLLAADAKAAADV